MSIFVRDFVAIGRTEPIGRADGMQKMVEAFRGKSNAELRGACREFSLFIFRYLGFSMSLDDVADAWKDVEGRVKYDRVDSTRKANEDRTLRGTFGYVELVSLQSGVLARMQRLEKVERQHVNEAVLKITCPFHLEGWCD